MKDFSTMSNEELAAFTKEEGLFVDFSQFNDSDSLWKAVQKAYEEKTKLDMNEGEPMTEEKTDCNCNSKENDFDNSPRFKFLFKSIDKRISRLPCHCYLFEMFMIENDLSLSDIKFLINIKTETKINGNEELEIKRSLPVSLPNFVFNNSVGLVTYRLTKLNDFLSRENISIDKSYEIIETLREKVFET